MLMRCPALRASATESEHFSVHFAGQFTFDLLNGRQVRLERLGQ